jgi:hypothetical protein
MVPHRLRWLALPLALALLPAPARAADEEDIRTAFADLQKALKAKDADKIWALLDTSTQKAANVEAESIRADYDKSGTKDKAKLEKALGLTKDEIGKLSGKSYLKSTKFHAKTYEIPDGKVTKVTVDGDKATVFYDEPDGDKEKLNLVRQDGKWKLIVPVK